MLLRSHADAAEHGRAGHRCVDREAVEIVQNLRRELTRRRQDQRTRRAPRLVDEMMHDRQQEGGRLAAAGLRGGDDVTPLQRRWDGFRLNGSRPDVPEILDGLGQRGMELQLSEWHG